MKKRGETKQKRKLEQFALLGHAVTAADTTTDGPRMNQLEQRLFRFDRSLQTLEKGDVSFICRIENIYFIEIFARSDDQFVDCVTRNTENRKEHHQVRPYLNIRRKGTKFFAFDNHPAVEK